MMALPTQISPIRYGTFCDEINQDSVYRIFENFDKASQLGVQIIHLLFQSPGGNVSAAVALYRYFLHLPFELHIYNPSAVCSAAIVPFVGAEHRYASEHAGFVTHPAQTHDPTPLDAAGHLTASTLLSFDDNRSQAIIKSRTQVPASKWTANDVLLSAQEALQFGLVHAIGDFQPPKGTRMFNI
jgi:ATP-dependent protease ClpP protease subunit